MLRAASQVLVRHGAARPMSTVRGSAQMSDGCELAYTRYNPGGGGGDTKPLLLVGGWTCPRDLWGALMTNGLYKEPRFSAGREVIAFDNRGVGESSVTEGPYSVGQLAADAAGLLSDLGHESAHVLGLSMGGMVAQQLAADAPETVASMVLCSTTAGGKLMTAADKGFARSFFGSFRGWADDDDAAQLDAARSFVRGCLAPRNRLSNQSGQVERMARAYLWAGKRSAEGMNNQLGALGTFGGVDLGTLPQAALVVHGSHDQVLPFANAVTLAAELPAARLLALDGHGHLWPYTHESAVRSIDKFLLDVEAGSVADAYTAETYAHNYN